MGLGNAFSTLSRLVTHWEGGAVDVVTARPHDADVVATEEVSVDVELRVPFGGPVEGGDDRTVETEVEDGTLTVQVSERTPLLPSDVVEDGVAIDSREARISSDGHVDLELSLRIPTDRGIVGGGSASVSADGGNAPATTDGPDQSAPGTAARPERDPDVPPYEDVEYLEALYESCDTFAEVAEAFEMDVTAETVRRYMIDAGVHDPTSYDTGDPTTPNADGDGTEVSPESDDRDVEVLVTDGIGLPEGMSLDEFIGVVRRSNTLYDVTREMDLDREEAREFLDDLNLLDLVVGRLSTMDERTVTREEAVERMHESVT